ncbi:MAG: hypothetical protein K8T25_14065 [Planctomycetia bacterium]|nr:hypothetical protein [Planctomycetia bacterium]
MNKLKILIGGVLAGAVGPALGISANGDHSIGKIIAAVCFCLVGVGLIIHELAMRKAA